MIQEVVAEILGELLTAHLERKAAYAAKPGELRYGLAMKISGLLFFLVSAGFTALLVTGNYRVGNPVETVSLVVLIASFGMGAVYLTGRSFFANGRYDGESICFKSPFSRTKTEKWKDLKAVTYNKLFRWYALKFENGTVIRISLYLGGYGYLLKLLKKKRRNFYYRVPRNGWD